MRSLLIIVVALAIAGGRANAYPQFQLSKDQTCTSCHLSPSGGGLLNENGANVAEAMSMFGQNPAFMYGAIETPDWLSLGGDLRGQWGYLQAPQRYLIGFPMQLDAYAAATKNNFSLHATVGYRTHQEGNEALTTVWARELYGMWQSEPGSSYGLFARVGQFMPVFGLRWVEHPLYVRRYGGTPLFSETPAVSVSYITGQYEVHATGFTKNPLYDPVRLSSGGALYGEYRLGEHTQIGAGGMYEHQDWEYKLRGELTAKQYLPGPDLLLQAEVQLINPHVSGYGYRGLASVLMATYFMPKGVMIDAAWQHYDENLRIKDLDRDGFDLNVHWFATSHIELILANQVEFMAFGKGGPTGAYSFLQLHYRL
ncbi:MAG TPA: hypothetical protein VFV99_15195 [Kofleriaceae bacterium]|nr:hypothetical protein [Kofleriaceae bacterium]